MEIITAQTACNRINNVMGEMDLDDLARTVSLLTQTNGVIVVDDGVELDEDDSLTFCETTLRNLVAEGTVGISDAFVDGLPFGYVDERGQVQEFPKPFDMANPLNEQDQGTMNEHLDNGDLVPIYDASNDKVVCYAHKNYALQIMNALEKNK